MQGKETSGKEPTIRLMRILVLILATFLSAAPTALAEGWKPTLSSHDFGPDRVVAVDKSTQTLMLLERKSPLREILRFPCTTGQVVGDKMVEGDLRTPEGVYFVGHRINRSLDWGLYGDIAYSLNYPNPIDRIKGKTGFGIWIHGRGKEFVPRDTRGCVALRTPDMQDVAREFELGTPVVIASDLDWTADMGEHGAEAAALVDALHGWAEDWQRRDEAFFDRYDAELMSLSMGRSFDGFVANTRNIFAAKPWIHVMVDNVQAVPGPDYWVTSFDQYYRTPGRTTSTGKRFYWMRSEDGAWRIVGREYVPARGGLEEKYIEAKTIEAEAFVESWRKAWLAMDAEGYRDMYAADAVQGKRRGAAAFTEFKKTLWAKSAPVTVSVDELTVRLHPRGLQVAFKQTFEDSSGYGDVGRKTMILSPKGESWTISSEQWRRGG